MNTIAYQWVRCQWTQWNMSESLRNFFRIEVSELAICHTVLHQNLANKHFIKMSSYANEHHISRSRATKVEQICSLHISGAALTTHTQRLPQLNGDALSEISVWRRAIEAKLYKSHPFSFCSSMGKLILLAAKQAFKFLYSFEFSDLRSQFPNNRKIAT